MAELQRYNILSPDNTGYPMPDNWYIVKPKAAINRVTNPSFERNLDGWSGYSSIERNAVTSYNGGYSLQIYGDGVTVNPAVSMTITGVAEGDVVTFSAFCLYPFDNAGGGYEARIAI